MKTYTKKQLITLVENITNDVMEKIKKDPKLKESFLAELSPSKYETGERSKELMDTYMLRPSKTDKNVYDCIVVDSKGKEKVIGTAKTDEEGYGKLNAYKKRGLTARAKQINNKIKSEDPNKV